MLWISGRMQVQRRGTEQMKPLDLMVVKQAKMAMRWREEENLGLWISVVMCRISEGYCRVMFCNQ